MIDSTYSRLSPLGSVSSMRRLQVPLYWAAMPKLRQTDLAWPMWMYPFGSGGNRVATRPWNLFVLKCSSMISLMKSVGAGWSGWFGWVMDLLPFHYGGTRLLLAALKCTLFYNKMEFFCQIDSNGSRRE